VGVDDSYPILTFYQKKALNTLYEAGLSILVLLIWVRSKRIKIGIRCEHNDAVFFSAQ